MLYWSATRATGSSARRKAFDRAAMAIGGRVVCVAGVINVLPIVTRSSTAAVRVLGVFQGERLPDERFHRPGGRVREGSVGYCDGLGGFVLHCSMPRSVTC